MAIYTFLNDPNRERYSKVSDTELDELLQDVRKSMPDVYVQEHIHEVTALFGKKKEYFTYSVYHDEGYDARVVNLPFDQKSNVYTYLCGLLNGYNAKTLQDGARI